VGLVELSQRINKGVTRISELESVNKPVPSDWNEHLTKLINEYKTDTVRTLLDEINKNYPIGLFAWLNENNKSLYKENIEIENKLNDLLKDNNQDTSQFEIEVKHLKEWYTKAISLYNNEYDSVLINSENLNKDIWICKDEQNQSDIISKQRDAIFLAIDELKILSELNPDLSDYKKIIEAKEVFNNASVIGVNPKKGGENSMGYIIEAVELIEPGTYEVIITDVKVMSGKFGDSQQVDFELEDGRGINGIFPLKATPNNKTGILFIKALGEFRTANSDELIGKTVTVLVEEKQSNGNTYTNVTKVM